MATINQILTYNLVDLAMRIGKRHDDVTTIIYRAGGHSHIVSVPSGEIRIHKLDFVERRPQTSLSFFHTVNGRQLYTAYIIPTQLLSTKSVKYHRNMSTVFQPSHSGYSRIGPIVRQWLDDIHSATVGNREQIQHRAALIKEDLVAAAWHPQRVERWLEQGVELESL